jgi:hypothetical protein
VQLFSYRETKYTLGSGGGAFSIPPHVLPTAGHRVHNVRGSDS